MNRIIIDCDECIMRATPACSDCLVSHVCDTSRHPSGHGSSHATVVFDIAEQRAVRWFAEAGMVPTLRHRAAASS